MGPPAVVTTAAHSALDQRSRRRRPRRALLIMVAFGWTAVAQIWAAPGVTAVDNRITIDGL